MILVPKINYYQSDVILIPHQKLKTCFVKINIKIKNILNFYTDEN